MWWKINLEMAQFQIVGEKNKWIDCPTYVTFLSILTWCSISLSMCKNFISLLSTLMSKVEFFLWLLFPAKLFAPLLGKRWWCPLRLEIAPWGGRLSYSTVGTPLGMLLIPSPTLLKYKYKYNTTPLGMQYNPICMIPIPTLLKQPLKIPDLSTRAFERIATCPPDIAAFMEFIHLPPAEKSSTFVAPMNAFLPFSIIQKLNCFKILAQLLEFHKKVDVYQNLDRATQPVASFYELCSSFWFSDFSNLRIHWQSAFAAFVAVFSGTPLQIVWLAQSHDVELGWCCTILFYCNILLSFHIG